MHNFLTIYISSGKECYIYQARSGVEQKIRYRYGKQISWAILKITGGDHRTNIVLLTLNTISYTKIHWDILLSPFNLACPQYSRQQMKKHSVSSIITAYCSLSNFIRRKYFDTNHHWQFSRPAHRTNWEVWYSRGPTHSKYRWKNVWMGSSYLRKSSIKMASQDSAQTSQPPAATFIKPFKT